MLALLDDNPKVLEALELQGANLFTVLGEEISDLKRLITAHKETLETS